MYGKQTLEDIRNLDIFLGDPFEEHINNVEAEGDLYADGQKRIRAAMNEEAEDNRVKLSDALNWQQSIREDKKAGKMIYSTRDFSKEPVIDKTKKEVTFETKEGIKRVFAYEIDDTIQPKHPLEKALEDGTLF